MNTNTLINDNIVKKFGKNTLFIGVILMIIGATGAILPQLMSLETVTFVAVFMLLGGAMWATHTFKYARSSVMDWLKPLILVFTGGWMLYSPAAGIAALGLLLSFYLMMDAFGSFTLAQAHYPAKGWGWMLVNGLFSLALAVLFLIGWPATSIWLVGLYVAISLLFDGIALSVIGWYIRKAA